jgi:hypothetical protein
VRWAWSFKGRRSDHRYKEGNGSVSGNAGPDFLCIGAHKAGTTWPYQQLNSHPDFWTPPVKELHYFDQMGRVQRASSPRRTDERDLRFLENLAELSAKPHLDLANYARLFEPKGALLFLARDAVERVWSHLSMEVHYRQIEPFDVTDIGEVNRRLVCRGMLLRSYPSVVVARWKRYIDPERFRIYPQKKSW